jgi:hypothetical protein
LLLLSKLAMSLPAPAREYHVEDGQFDDAPDDGGPEPPAAATAEPVTAAPPTGETRPPGEAFIDDPEAALLAWSEPSDDEAEEDDDHADEPTSDYDDARVEDEDWEMAERGARAGTASHRAR